MSPADFLQELERHDIRLKAENGHLRFFAKPGAMTPELKARIAERKADLLAHLLAAENAEHPEVLAPSPQVTRTSRDQPIPLSFAQERLWFLDQLEGPSATYNLYDASRLGGSLKLAPLEKAVALIVQRHEALRTTFRMLPSSDQSIQVIHPSMAVPLTVTDLSGEADDRKWNQAIQAANEVIRQPFNLATGPLVRTHLFRLSPDDHLFVLVVHHIVFDKWSADLFRRELAAAYAAFTVGQSPALPEINIHFADFTVWERANLTDNKGEAEIKFWREYLSPLPPALDLPTSYPRPARQNYRGDQTLVLFPPALVQQMRQLARQERATLFHVLMAGWNILLRRYTGQSDLVVGTSVSNRTQAELQAMVGFVVNVVPIRTRLPETLLVRDLIRLTKESALSALAHGDMPFERLVRELTPPRSLDVSPIFQVALSFVRTTESSQQFHDLTLTPISLKQGVAKFDLTLWLNDRPDGLLAALEYTTDLFSPERAQSMLAHFGRLLEGMIAQPEGNVDQLPLLTATERRLILQDWNQTKRAYPAERCLHRLFEEQARLQPTARALVFKDRTLTYAALDQKADELAAVLRSLGVGPDVLVGLCVERSLEMVVGILGILKAGGAYVPIDPAYPSDRIAFVLEDSKAPVLVTQQSLQTNLPVTQAKRLFLDAPLPIVNAPATPSTLRPDNLAYVLYTSGSTGKPKGVQISHGAVVNFLQSMRREPGLTAQDVLLAVTTLSFDIAGLEVHLPLTTGACIVIAPWEVAADGEALRRAIDQHKITLLQATPATWRLLLAAGWPGTPTLKILCGGEALPADLAAELIPRCAELWNMYGPTETTIWSTCSRVTDASDIHIGRPIDNTEIYILDLQQQPLPVGVAGELLIGGDGLARGYLHRPELTAERFIPHPFQPGAKLYRTGDLARYRADGNIDCLGRLDFQVKIRGFRIELGEIETILAAHPGIKHNVVTAREDTPGDKRLVAYLVAHSAPPDAGALRDFLRGKLPEYMTPAAFVFLPALPLTPNGKIDRKALPAPNTEAAPAQRDKVPPGTDTEKKLAEIFATVLNRPVPSIADSFFDLGGHSLLATKLMAAIERQFGRRVPLAQLFSAPAVRELAAYLDGGQASNGEWNSLVPIRPQPGRPTLFLIHGAGGNVLLYREVADALGQEISVYGFQSQGLDRRARVLTTVEEMAGFYVTELRAFQPSGPYHLSGYCLGGSIAYEMARLLRAQGQEVGLVALLDTYNLSLAKRSGERQRFSFFRQKVGFHLSNLRQLGARDMVRYILDKGGRAGAAARVRLASYWNNSAKRLKGQVEEEGAEVLIGKINHEAAWAYVPPITEERITVFRPHKNYDFMPDPKLGWGTVVPAGHLDLVQLPVNPHAMLTKPCAAQLARELATRLRRYHQVS